MTSHLIIPDAHAKPGTSQERFTLLGKLIRDLKPDVVVCLGDFADMHSLSSYDKGKASFFGASYREDISAALEAQDRIFTEVRRSKKKLPRFVMLGGNHEDRISRVLDIDHHLAGAISKKDLDYERRWEFHPFLEKVIIDGVTYSHYIVAGNSGKAMAGKFLANSLLTQEHCSTTVGHAHLLDYKETVTGQGKRIHGLSAGCFFEHPERYAVQSEKHWWRGVVLKRNVEKGEYCPSFIRLKDIKQAYRGR